MAYKRKSPQPIAEGGSNATSMTDTNGGMYFDGTRIVTTPASTLGYIFTSGGGGFPPAFSQPAFVSILSPIVFAASDTYTPSSSLVLFIKVEAWGGGGGGGGCAQGTNAGHGAAAGGGGSGAYSMAYGAAGIATVTVGAGGAGGTAGNNPGTNGGESKFTSGIDYVSAMGGTGGSGSPVAINLGVTSGGGAGGAKGTTGQFDCAGSPGQAGLCFNVGATNRWGQGGGGGSSSVGGGALSTLVGIASAAVAGINAGLYGSGGSGATLTGVQAAQAGGNGSDGVVIVTEYIVSF